MRNFFYFFSSRLSKKSKILIAITAVTALLSNSVILIIPLIQKQLMQKLTLGVFAVNVALTLLFLCLLSIIISIAESIIIKTIKRDFQQRMQRELISSPIETNNRMINQRGAGAYTVNAFGDSEQLAMIYETNYFSQVLRIVSAVISVVIASSWSYLFALIVIPSILLTVLTGILFEKPASRYFNSARELIIKLNPKIVEFLENRRSILSFSNLTYIKNDIFSQFIKRDNYFQKSEKIKTLSTSLTDAIKNIAYIVFFIVGASAIISKELDIASFIASLSYFPQSFLAVEVVQSIYASINRFKIIHERVEPNLEICGKTAIPNGSTFTFHRCSFSHGENSIIENLDLEINSIIGLVGLSGEGKTTIIRMLVGETAPHSGSCQLGGINISDISRLIVYSSIKYYSQEQELYDGDLLFNIALGKTPLSKAEYDGELLKTISKLKSSAFEKEEFARLFFLTDKQIKRGECDKIHNNLSSSSVRMLAEIIVSKRYYIDARYNEIVAALDIEYLNGRMFGHKGEKISGGEKNRICIARTLLPDTDGIFIIDEPFTALDTFAEKDCLSVLKNYTKGKHGIIISHKMNVIHELCDSIAVINKGVIVERGTHDELVKQKGLYAKLSEAQVLMSS